MQKKYISNIESKRIHNILILSRKHILLSERGDNVIYRLATEKDIPQLSVARVSLCSSQLPPAFRKLQGTSTSLD